MAGEVGDGIAPSLPDRQPAPFARARPSRGRDRVFLFPRRDRAEGRGSLARGGLLLEHPGRPPARLGLGARFRRRPLARAGRRTALPRQDGGCLQALGGTPRQRSARLGRARRAGGSALPPPRRQPARGAPRCSGVPPPSSRAWPSRGSSRPRSRSGTRLRSGCIRGRAAVRAGPRPKCCCSGSPGYCSATNGYQEARIVDRARPPDLVLMALEAGKQAPDFSLNSTPDQKVSLSELRGRRVILAFYPADWSPVCSDQLPIYSELLPEFRRYGADIMGISVDGVWCHAAFAKDRKLRFPLLADFEPKGEVARAYDVYRKKDGFSERALFVIDREGIIRWSYVSPIGINPGADGILEALESMEGKKS